VNEQIELVLSYLRDILRRKWWILGSAWLVCAIGWVVVQRLPDQYEASARVYVDTKSLLKPLLRGLTIEMDVNQQVRLMERTLLSRPNLEKIIRMADLDLSAGADEEFEALIASVGNRIHMKRDSEENLYSINYPDSDPERAKRVVQAVVTTFVENTLGEGKGDGAAASAQRFLDKQIGEYEARLRESEDRLKEFKQKNVAFMSGSGGYFGELKSATEQLEAARLQVKEMQQRRDTLREQVQASANSSGGDDELLLPTPGMGSASTQYDGRIARLNEQLDSLLLKYTENHPSVVEIRNTLKNLEELRQKDLQAQAQQPQSEFSSTSDPLKQQLKLAFSQAEAELASLNARVQSYEQKVHDLQNRVDTVPQIEADLANLNRDYGIAKQKYEEFLGRRESALISQKVEEDANDIQFRVIDPPRVPTAPAGPNRLLLMSATLGGGLLLGLGVATLFAVLRPTFTSTLLLAQMTNLQVLGTVSFVTSSALRKRHRLESILFVAGALLLVAVYAALASYYAFIKG